MDRRSFLGGASILVLGQALAACNAQNRERLNVQLLKNSIPVQLLNEFRRTLQQPAELEFAPEIRLSQLFTLLQTWKQTEKANDAQSKSAPLWGFLPFTRSETVSVPDLVTLGDYWLTVAIQQGLVQPLDVASLSNWQNVPSRWQELVRRNEQGQLSETGQIWAAPYRWGTTVIAYRADKFKSEGLAPPQDWSDLWRPELRDRISLLDQAREVIGLTLKKLNQSYNTENPQSVRGLPQELQALHQQVKFYSSDNYLQPLIIGDTWVAVGWSTDVMPLLQSDRNIKAVVPQSGTRLWADLWVRPASRDRNSGNSNSLFNQWINFGWQPQTAIQLSLLSDAASPVVAGLPRSELPKSLQNQPLLLPAPEVLQRSDFLYPLSDAALKQYRELWTQMRRSRTNER